ncbi:hypothetical protein LTS18_002119, partial [Coniosporium uncinatum]
DQRQAPEGCPVVPSHHRRHPRRQTEDQRFARTKSAEGSRGGRFDQEGRCAQQAASV